MKVNSQEMNINNIYSENQLKSVRSRNQSGKAQGAEDKVEISGESMSIGSYVDKIKDMPDIRADKVEEIKQRIESGGYSISSGELASKMLNAIKEGKEKP